MEGIEEVRRMAACSLIASAMCSSDAGNEESVRWRTARLERHGIGNSFLGFWAVNALIWLLAFPPLPEDLRLSEDVLFIASHSVKCAPFPQRPFYLAPEPSGLNSFRPPIGIAKSLKERRMWPAVEQCSPDERKIEVAVTSWLCSFGGWAESRDNALGSQEARRRWTGNILWNVF